MFVGFIRNTHSLSCGFFNFSLRKRLAIHCHGRQIVRHMDGEIDPRIEAPPFSPTNLLRICRRLSFIVRRIAPPAPLSPR